MLLSNGSAIKQDVIDSFNRAIDDEFNLRSGFGTTEFWNFVESDMYMDLRMFYSSEYINQCFEALADDYEGVA
jgi:hypothetical protein